MKDPYKVLGVTRDASADQIKVAYRALARELHPDVNPGDLKAEERFKEISAAYDFLSDADKRAQFDRGEIDATGAHVRRAHTHHSQSGGFRQGGTADDFGFGGGDVNEILAEMMRRKDKGRKSWGSAWGFGTDEPPKESPKPGQDAHHTLRVSFAEAVNGTTKRVTLTTGKSLDVRIPPGSSDGQSLRLKGQGFPGVSGINGDAFIDIKVDSHQYLTQRDQDLLLDLPISITEAVLGSKITVPTLDGQVALTIPPGSNTGTILRLKGKGLKSTTGTGDQLVTLKVVLPDEDAELRKFVEKWGAKNPYNPRAKLGF